MLPGINSERRDPGISEKYITDGNCQRSVHIRMFCKSPLNDHDAAQSTLNKLDQSPRGNRESSQNMRSRAEDQSEMKLLLCREENEVAYILNPHCKI